MEREESRQSGWVTQKWLGLLFLKAVELSRHLNMALFWFYPPAVSGSALVGHETWLNIHPPPPDWEILVDVGKDCRDPGNSAGLSSACCSLPWIWRRTSPTCSCEGKHLLHVPALLGLCSAHPRRALQVCAILLGLVPAVPAVHLCVVFAGTWHTAANAALATYILLLNPSKSFRIIFKTCHSHHFSNYC